MVKKIINISLLALLSFILVGLFYAINSTSSNAANLSLFKPGNLMTDYVMTDKDSMTESQIQAFLNSKNPCNDSNTAKATQYPQYTYNIKNGKFVCLAQESFNGESAARIIWQAAQDYNINPQVLIVLLQKEQSLITDTWPNNIQYRSATGYGCPDTADCDGQYFGFKNQVRNAANFFRAYQTGNTGWYKLVWPGNKYTGTWTPFYYDVRLHPNIACGTVSTYIENRATASLYSYTPYRPNQAALNAYTGHGDGCSSYGNRNFWIYFNDWFGTTQSDGIVSLDDPRWMQVNQNTQKVDFDLSRFGPVIQSGAQAKFIDKIRIDGRWVARTQYDHTGNNRAGFFDDELSEIEFESITPVWMIVNKDTYKYDMLRDKNIESTKASSFAKFVDKITVNGKTYYRTEYEAIRNQSRGYLVSDLSPFTLTSFVTPRIMITKSSVKKINPLTQQTVETIPAGEMIYFNKLITLDGVLYAQAMTDNDTNLVIDSTQLGEVSSNPFKSFVTPRVMEVQSATYGYNVGTKSITTSRIDKGRHYYFVDQITVNGIWYARTQEDSQSNTLQGIPVSHLGEVTVTKNNIFTTTLKNNSYKIDPIRNIRYESLSKGAPATFVDSVVINGQRYYRTEWEANQNRPRFIPASDLN